MSRYFPGQVKQPKAGDGIDCERARWAEERIGAAQAQGAEGSGFAATRSDHVCRGRGKR